MELPKCERVGCPNRVKHAYRMKKGRKVPVRFCSPACVPHEVYATGGGLARKNYSYTLNARRFRAILQRVQGRPMSAHDLLELLKQAWNGGYNARRVLEDQRRAAAQKRQAAA
jgi:hypothetical protein